MVSPMTIFDDLATAMGSLVGDAALGSWLLGALVVIALLLPIGLVFRKGGNGTVLILVTSGLAVTFNVGVGWWDTWAVVFIALIILMGWWVSKSPSGEGGV